MERISTSTAAPGNLFTGGNPGLGIPPTVIDATWLNNVQEELVSIINGAPNVQTLNSANYGQVLAALHSLFGAPRRTIYAAIGEASSSVPAKSWVTGASNTFQRAELCIDPSCFITVPQYGVVIWSKIGISNPTSASITFNININQCDDGVNVFWQGSSILTATTVTSLPASASITIPAGGSGVFEVVYYNSTTSLSTENPGILELYAGSPFPSGLVLYDAGGTFS